MKDSLPTIYLARHGETAWSASGQHTGRTDLPLTERGEENARLLGKRLAPLFFDHVFTSPRIRARRTCELAGFGKLAVVDNDLAEWDYGDYEGKRTAEIRAARPDWDLFRDGCPGGESVEQITARAERVVARWRTIDANILVFSSGHILRAIAARWIGLETSRGRNLLLGTATVSVLGYDHNRDEPAVRLWNDDSHLHV
jgi:probable phosphoglycerate mutase